MNNRIKAIFAVSLAVLALTCVPSISRASNAQSCPMVGMSAKATKGSIKCAVTGEVIPSPSKAINEVYNGKSYYFCCQSCKQKFDKNRAKFVKNGYVVTKSKSAKKKA